MAKLSMARLLPGEQHSASQWLDQSTHKGPLVSVHELENCRQFEQNQLPAEEGSLKPAR
ncbi:MAG: hypothetical protein GY800_07965 [Planctomycetes bacterium]|nr:hypothetical protein [Planctomycetota bacterium]